MIIVKKRPMSDANRKRLQHILGIKLSRLIERMEIYLSGRGGTGVEEKINERQC